MLPPGLMVRFIMCNTETWCRVGKCSLWGWRDAREGGQPVGVEAALALLGLLSLSLSLSLTLFLSLSNTPSLSLSNTRPPPPLSLPHTHACTHSLSKDARGGGKPVGLAGDGLGLPLFNLLNLLIKSSNSLFTSY